MTERTRFQKLIMTTLTMHTILSFAHASFTDDSVLAYVCLFYCAFYVIGQYLIRTYIKKFLPHVLLHLLLIIPSLGFFSFSPTDGVIMTGTAIISTMLSFKKSIDFKKKGAPTDDTIMPGAILLFVLFAMLGKVYGYTNFSKFVLAETIIYCVLFVSYTLFTNEAHYIRDHVATMNIPTSRIRKFTKRLRLLFACIIVFVMLTVSGINVALPKLGLKFDTKPYTNVVEDTIKRDPDHFDIKVLGEEEPSMLAVFLGYVAIFIASILIIITIFVVIIVLIKELYGSIGGSAHKKKEYIEEEEITVEALNPFVKKERKPKLPKDNALKIRKLYHDYVLRKLDKSDRSFAKMILTPKTPKEIEVVINKESSATAVATSDDIQRLYEETRYADNYVPTDNDVTRMKTLTSYKN